jgi:hypothetical protein
MSKNMHQFKNVGYTSERKLRSDFGLWFNYNYQNVGQGQNPSK